MPTAESVTAAHQTPGRSTAAATGSAAAPAMASGIRMRMAWGYPPYGTGTGIGLAVTRGVSQTGVFAALPAAARPHPGRAGHG